MQRHSLHRKSFKSNNFIQYQIFRQIWFRELPELILNCVSAETVKNKSETPKECFDIYAHLPEPNKSLFQWLLDILADVAAREAETKMNAKTLAIVIGPNLYSLNLPDALESVALSQKIVNLVQNLILYKMHQKYEM